ncbi:TRAM domain-containing protein [Candidatus Saccharibacteria bacterium]|nr:TRAM domain-containing protein [Candidatus Saccharibacteria bacterium]
MEIILLGLVFLGVVLLLIKGFWEFRPRPARRQVLVDSSVLMDARVLALARTGFIGDELLIMQSVLLEMQTVADGKDSEKRARARIGLDAVEELQRTPGLVVRVIPQEPEKGVDNQLLKRAKRTGALIMTNDFNLGKVALADNLKVLNMNALSQNLRSEYLPGDKTQIKLVQKGSGKGQGVGYMPDGTMVVVDDSDKKIGEFVEIEVTRMHQTAAGRMMFARLT